MSTASRQTNTIHNWQLSRKWRLSRVPRNTGVHCSASVAEPRWKYIQGRLFATAKTQTAIKMAVFCNLNRAPSTMSWPACTSPVLSRRQTPSSEQKIIINTPEEKRQYFFFFFFKYDYLNVRSSETDGSEQASCTRFTKGNMTVQRAIISSR